MRNRRHAPVFFRSAAPPLLNALPPARVATSFTACCCFSRLCCLYIYSYEVAYHLLYLAFLPAVFFIRIQYYAVNFPPWSLGHFVFSCYPASLASEASLPGAPVSFFFRQACALNGCDRRIRPCSISPGTPLLAFFLHQKTACPVWGTRFCAISFSFAWMGCRGSSSPRIPRHTCSAPRPYPGPRALSKTALPRQTGCS